MGAQYSTGVVAPEWKSWLEERCSLEIVRGIYKDFRIVISSSKDRDNDGFFVTGEEFRQVRYVGFTAAHAVRLHWNVVLAVVDCCRKYLSLVSYSSRLCW